MSESMFNELCDKCHKSLFMIHPDDQFNCHCPDESDTSLFVFDEEDEEAVSRTSECQLKDLEVGEAFIFNGKKFTKRNKMGWGLGVGNIEDAEGNFSHLHPTTSISLIH